MLVKHQGYDTDVFCCRILLKKIIINFHLRIISAINKCVLLFRNLWCVIFCMHIVI